MQQALLFSDIQASQLVSETAYSGEEKQTIFTGMTLAYGELAMGVVSTVNQLLGTRTDSGDALLEAARNKHISSVRQSYEDLLQDAF